METTTMPRQRTTAAEWRRLSPSVWVGRLDGHPIGMIERGRRFSLTDQDERVFDGYRTLEAAQAAALLPASRRIPAVETSAGRSSRVLTALAGTAGMLTIGAATTALLLIR